MSGAHRCEHCGKPVLLSGLGGWTGSRATLPPLKALCLACVDALGLEVLEDAAWKGVRYQGRLYLDVFRGQGFVRSEHPDCAHVYAGPFPRSRVTAPTVPDDDR